MISALTEKEFVKLQTYFVVPLITKHMLEGIEPLDDVAEYTFHEILREFRPDTALLCMALCAYHIGEAVEEHKSAKMLRLHAVNVIDEYGPLWLAHEAQDPNLCDEDIRESLAHIPEDIEAMADLLDATLEDLSETHSILAILCDILSLQAHMHKELAAIELSGLSLTPPQNETKGTVQVQKLDDNILVFPSQSAANSGEYVSS